MQKKIIPRYGLLPLSDYSIVQKTQFPQRYYNKIINSPQKIRKFRATRDRDATSTLVNLASRRHSLEFPLCR